MENMILIAVVAALAGLVWLKIKLPVIKGRLGEKRVALTLSFLPDDRYIVLNDLMFRNGERTTQIDHIVVSVYGIFVIETKNYKGWVYGNAGKEYWTHNVWGRKHQFYNPVFQNQGHIRFLTSRFRELRELAPAIWPVVVFLHVTRLSVSGWADCVIERRKLKRYIRSRRELVMTMDDCRHIASLLTAANITDRKERRSHKANVKAAIRHRKENPDRNVCPRCGAPLVRRTGRYGPFYGCSNYPACRYTRAEGDAS